MSCRQTQRRRFAGITGRLTPAIVPAEAARRNADSTAWLAVRVKNGRAVIEGLYIHDVPIEQLVAGSGS